MIIGLTIYVMLFLIPGLPLAFTWLRFRQLRNYRDFRAILTTEFPLFVVTGSYLLFFILGFVALSLTFFTVPLTGDFHVHALVWSNVVISFMMSVLALLGKSSLRWRLVGSATAVSFAWFVVGLSIFAVEQAGRWVL